MGLYPAKLRILSGFPVAQNILVITGYSGFDGTVNHLSSHEELTDPLPSKLKTTRLVPCCSEYTCHH